jgi:hypothetical protein
VLRPGFLCLQRTNLSRVILKTCFQDKKNVEGLFDFEGFLLKEGKPVGMDGFWAAKSHPQELHDSPYAGHQGVKKTLALVRRHHWWPTMFAYIERYMLKCHLCQKNKAQNTLIAWLLQPLNESIVALCQGFSFNCKFTVEAESLAQGDNGFHYPTA